MLAVLACAAVSVVGSVSAEELPRGAEIHITRAAGPISVDGSLSDPGWSGAARVDTWFETQPGDNVPPKVRSVGYLTYDDRYFYAGFEFHDPDPSRIRAPYSDRDDISESIDYGGVVLDTRNDGRTGILFLATPRGIQYDAVQDDATGSENSSPDFYWDSAGTITNGRLGAGDPHPILVASLLRRRGANLGHHALPELPPGLPLPDSSPPPCRAAGAASSAARTS